ncbi:2-oxo acid dehydrogenase subunit E2 [candidate division KSB1 bacterium]|nr:2-oxo acid dehydrogenase subunit E2 [candidate division KSB1 bacterium]
MQDIIGTYKKTPLSFFRRFMIDTLDVAMQKHYVKAFLELDVTDTRTAIRDYRRNHTSNISFLAFVIKCMGDVLAKYPELNTMRQGKHGIQFDDIDMAVAIEMELGEEKEKVPRLIVIRKINTKSIAEIHQEIHSAKQQNIQNGNIEFDDQKNIRLIKMIMGLPRFLRKQIWKMTMNNPFFIKRLLGTVSITALGMFGKLPGYVVPLPTAQHPISFALGSIIRKPWVVRDEVQSREILSMTIFFDHDIIDGAPAARFTNTLKKYIESGEALGAHSI